MRSIFVYLWPLVILRTSTAFVVSNSRRHNAATQILPEPVSSQSITTASTFLPFPTLATRSSWERRATVASTAQQDTSETQSNMTMNDTKKIGSVVFLIPSEGADERTLPFGSQSPVGNPSLTSAVAHLCNKATWFADGLVDATIVPVPTADDDSGDASLLENLKQSNVLLAVGLQSEHDLTYAQGLFEARANSNNAEQKQRQCQFALACAATATPLPFFVGPYNHVAPSVAARLVPWSIDATGRRLYEQMTALFDKWSSDEMVFGILLFLNQFSGSEVDWVKYSIDATWEKGPVRNLQEIYAMVTNCGDCIGRCVQDDECRECLNALTALDTRDQVASYRTIVSYESDLLRDFSFCILQKHNIFNCDAQLPTLPVVPPLTTFRGQPLTQDMAKSLLVGHLHGEETALQGNLELPVSWEVACGANEAYDKFPSQNQLFYPATKGRDLWYDPVFRVETLDGRYVWCKRHYKVRPGKVPGTFYFSVLDNGITSNEFWTIVGVADDLSWIVFHYAGAAAAVGQRYLGGLLCTPHGNMPSEEKLPAIWKCVQAAGMQPWELYKVNNDLTAPGYLAAGPPPLDFFRNDVVAQRQKTAT